MAPVFILILKIIAFFTSELYITFFYVKLEHVLFFDIQDIMV